MIVNVRARLKNLMVLVVKGGNPDHTATSSLSQGEILAKDMANSILKPAVQFTLTGRESGFRKKDLLVILRWRLTICEAFQTVKVAIYLYDKESLASYDQGIVIDDGMLREGTWTLDVDFAVLEKTDLDRIKSPKLKRDFLYSLNYNHLGSMHWNVVTRRSVVSIAPSGEFRTGRSPGDFSGTVDPRNI